MPGTVQYRDCIKPWHIVPLTLEWHMKCAVNYACPKQHVICDFCFLNCTGWRAHSSVL